MWRTSWIFVTPTLCSLLFALSLSGQNNDCVTAQVICSDGPINFNPGRDIGIDDFANPNNDPGCFELATAINDTTAENGSGWYYFEFREDMPPNSVIEFTITPFGFLGEDYDFLIFGPDVACDSLGEPVRCSFADFNCGFCPSTGLGMGAMDEWEGVWFDEPNAIFSDGFLAPMTVQPGEGYYLMLDNFARTSRGFNLQWGGSAAPFLNCNANPFCDNATVSAGENFNVCEDQSSFTLNGAIEGYGPGATIQWSGTAQAMNFLSDPNVLTPTVNIPDGFTGSLQFFLTVQEDDCTLADDVEVQVLPMEMPDILGDAAFCTGESTLLDAGAGYQAYRWSSGDTTQTIEVSTPGIYTVTVTNGSGCTGTDQIEVTMAPMPAPVISGNSTVCGNETTILDAGDGFQTYLWSNGATTRTTEVNTPGNYRVTVTNAVGCSGEAEITINQFDNPTPAIIGDSVFCFDQNTILRTSATFAAYEWSDSSTEPTIEVESSGLITVTVTDANGCRGADTIIVEERQPLSAAITGDTSFCTGESTSLEATPGLAYRWSTGATTADISVSAAGTYQVTVTDADNCEAILSATVTEDSLPEPVIRGASGLCPGQVATLETDPIYEAYRWSNGANTPSIQVSTPDIYALEVETTAGCVGNASFEVSAFSAPAPEITGDTVFCVENGTTLATAMAHDAYRWSTGDTTPAIQVFDSGTYSLTITDQNGCTNSNTITVEALRVDLPAGPDTVGICPGEETILDVGQNFASYVWSNGATTRTIPANAAGDYTVTVTNDFGCVATRQFIVLETNPPNVAIQGARMLCLGDSASLQATTGFAEYLWTTGDTTERIFVSTPGTYGVTVTAANGCQIDTEFAVTDFFDLPDPTILGDSTICDNEEISIRVSETYLEYTWSNGMTAQQILVDEVGDFTVTVTDENGCQGVETIAITQRAAPTVEITGQDFYCEGLMTTLRATSGYPFYEWSNGATGDSIMVMTPGVYSVTVSDGECPATDSLEVREIALPTADAGADQTLDCNINAVTLGGAAMSDTLDFEWTFNNEFFSTDMNPVVSEAGDYRLTVIDRNYGCRSVESSVRVFDRAYDPKIVLQTTGLLNCEVPEVVIDASESLMGDKIVYTWQDADGRRIANENTEQLTVREPGVYLLTVEDTQYGCTSTDSVEIQASFDFPIANAGADQTLTCSNDSVVLDGSASSDGPDIAIRWTTIGGNIVADNVTKTPMVNRPGSYVVAVENERNQCVSRDTVFVFENRTPPTAIAALNQQLNCTVNEVTLSGSGSSSNGAVRYEWEALNGYRFPNPTQQVVNTTEPGSYRLVVTDLENGCTAADSVTVVDLSNPPRRLEATLVNPICRGDRNGGIVFDTVIGGTGPYFFSLNEQPFEYVEQFNGLAAGRYQITVEDVEGCRYETAFELDEGFLLQVDLGDSKTVKLTEQALISPKVNVPRREIIELQWQKGIEAVCYDDCWEQYVQPFESTLYQVQVEDRKGCRATDQVMVFVNDSEDVFVPNAFSPNGNGINDKLVVYAGGAVALVKTFRIVSRWGGVVFERGDFLPNDAAYGWDGRYNGAMLDPGVFVYFVEVEYVDGRTATLKGDVTLMR